MKITYYTTGFLSDAAYSSGLRLFIQQYNGKFPGLCYLHLEIGEVEPNFGGNQEKLLYSGDGRGLKIQLAKWSSKSKPTPFEVYADLRLIFDSAVEAYLGNHQNEFFAETY